MTSNGESTENESVIAGMEADEPEDLEGRVTRLEAMLKLALRKIDELERDTAIREVCMRRERREALTALTARGRSDHGVVGPYVHRSGRKWFALGEPFAQFKAHVRRTGSAEVADSTTGAIYTAILRDGDIKLFDRTGELVGVLV